VVTASPSLTFEDPTAIIAFARPEKRNPIDSATWKRLPELIGLAVQRPETRVIVLRGEGGTFASGADIGEFDTVFADRRSSLAYLDDMTAATAAIEASPLPTLVQVEGLCIGAAVAVALAGDIRMVASDARFAITPARLGLMYSLADTRRVVAAVGPGAAKDLLFTGRLIDAATALRIGLVDEVHGPEALAEAVARKAELIARNSAWSNGRTKAVMRRIAGGAASDDDETRGWFADAPQGADFAEGLAAFRAGRPPEFPPR
jgi:enoyl-CoA hydratase/carnithine racemase